MAMFVEFVEIHGDRATSPVLLNLNEMAAVAPWPDDPTVTGIVLTTGNAVVVQQEFREVLKTLNAVRAVVEG